LAEALLEYETLDGVEINEIIDTGKLSNPPTPPKGVSSLAAPTPPEIPAVEAQSEALPATGTDPHPAGA